VGGWKHDTPWCYTANKCGQSAMSGYWMECDIRTIERRRANDGKFYDSKEFKKHYGEDSKDKWDKAKNHVERKLAANNKAYSAQEFRPERCICRR